jgi:hypothetical protein
MTDKTYTDEHADPPGAPLWLPVLLWLSIIDWVALALLLPLLP